MRKIIIFIGFLCLLDAIITSFFTLINFGTIFPGIVGSVFILYGLFYKTINKILDKNKLLKTCIQVCLSLFALSFIFFLLVVVSTSFKTPEKNVDAIIVLGAGLREDKVSKVLAARLNSSIPYLSDNPKTIVVVSGGKGRDESVSEAFAMKKFLVQSGVKENRIVMEDKSHNTYENFSFSKKILDAHFQMYSKNYSTIIVTNDFHVFRAKFLAKQVGFSDLSAIAAPSNPKYLVPNFYMREYFALIKSLIFKQ